MFFSHESIDYVLCLHLTSCITDVYIGLIIYKSFLCLFTFTYILNKNDILIQNIFVLTVKMCVPMVCMFQLSFTGTWSQTYRPNNKYFFHIILVRIFIKKYSHIVRRYEICTVEKYDQANIFILMLFVIFNTKKNNERKIDKSFNRQIYEIFPEII